ncbi:MAG: restriction endonuclease subunit S, partial [Pseudanabaena sp.]
LRLDDISEIGISETEWNRVKLKKDDLLIVEGNGSIEHIGRVALWDGSIDPCVHQNHLIKMRLGSLVLSKYALYWLLSPSGRNVIMQVASSSSGLHTLSISKVSSLPIPLCQIEEQKEIVRRVEKMFAKIDKMEEEFQKAAKLCDRLEQATLAKAFRGELVPQDPN